MTNQDIPDYLDSWTLHLTAERKSPQTVKIYGDGVRRFVRWCEDTGRPMTLAQITRPSVNAFVAALLEGGAEPATARSRQLAVRRFASWLAEEGELPADPLLGLKPPRLDVKVVQGLSEEQIVALIKACKGNEFRDRRDEALVRLMIETGARAGEVVAMDVADVDLKAGLAVVRRGKGGKGRTIPFGPQTARAIDRYVRLRRTHALAEISARLWLGDRSKPFNYDGLHAALKRRARAAGIEGFTPHLTRHTAATRWLDAGGSEGGLMAMAGWARRDMLDRYTRASSERRAAEEAQRLNLGDF